MLNKTTCKDESEASLPFGLWCALLTEAGELAGPGYHRVQGTLTDRPNTYSFVFPTLQWELAQDTIGWTAIFTAPHGGKPVEIKPVVPLPATARCGDTITVLWEIRIVPIK